MKRMGLLMLTNFAVVAVLGIVWNILDSIFGLTEKFMAMGLPAGFGYIALMAIDMGFGGSFISLLMSKKSAIKGMGVELIVHPTTEQERWLYGVVEKQAEQAGIAMPEVGIFHTHQLNAFATGARRNNALVAVSSGLLNHMTPEEVEAVLGHEIAHVANGDMVTQTLLQGVMNTFVILFSRLIAQMVSRGGNGRGGYGATYFIVSSIAQVCFGFLANIIVKWFSRYREFHADKGGADLAGRENMIAALEKLKQVHSPQELPKGMASFGISGGLPKGLQKLFTTHPPLDDRIDALRNAKY